MPGTTRTVSLPDLKPGTTYHVEVHGVRAGQTSKSYAFITTTGSVGGAAGPPISCPVSPATGVSIHEFLPLPHCSGCHPTARSVFKPYLAQAPREPSNKAHFLVSLDATSTLRVLVDTQGQGDLFFGTV